MDNADSIEIRKVQALTWGTELYTSTPQTFRNRIGRRTRRFFEMSSRWQSTHCGKNDSIGFEGENKLGYWTEKTPYSRSDGLEAATKVCESQYTPREGVEPE
jgi:hypothetical protein